MKSQSQLKILEASRAGYAPKASRHCQDKESGVRESENGHQGIVVLEKSLVSISDCLHLAGLILTRVRSMEKEALRDLGMVKQSAWLLRVAVAYIVTGLLWGLGLTFSC